MEIRNAFGLGSASALLAALVVTGIALERVASAADARLPGVGYLSVPSTDAPRDIAERFLRREAAAASVDDVVVIDEVFSRHNDVTHVYLRQRIGGIEVVNGDVTVNVDRHGRIVSIADNRVVDAAASANAASPVVTASEAVSGARTELGLPESAPLALLRAPGGVAEEAVFAGGGISKDEIPVKLMYFPVAPGDLRLTWSVVLRPDDYGNWWNLFVDAESGQVVGRHNWTAHASYEVFALPKSSPYDGPRTIEVDPADSVASPFAWHDINGVAGPEFTDTRGNNVVAQEDADGNDFGGFRPNGGASLDFQFPLDLENDEPPAYQEAAITNLFYWNNVIHDILYHYGFDEAAGNFQTNNYGNGGLGGDPVQADAQDSSGLNNADFSTPPDGTDPRMQMFIWTSSANAGHTVTINSPATIGGDYAASSANFGAQLSPTGITGDVTLVDDGSGNPSLGCGALVGFPPGSIALIDRGTCEFGAKVLNAENSGAIGAIVANNAGDELVTMSPGAVGDLVTIPSLFIGQTDGGTVKSELPGVSATLTGPSDLDRDSDLDASIIVHEYGHGISNRLTGGPSNVGCLQNQEQMGEGWSDWFGLALTAKATDSALTTRGNAVYSAFDLPDGNGTRPFPYSTDLAVNPTTYGDIDTLSIPHDLGSVWASMLWEMYWNLVELYGFNEDFYEGHRGNNFAIQLVVDGMKLQPCSPSFVDGRDAILTADQVNNSGINQCIIWEAFAKRGLGLSASAGSSNVVGDEVEAFDVPAACTAASDIFDDGFDSGNTGAWTKARGNRRVVPGGLDGSAFKLEVDVNGTNRKSFVEIALPAPERAFTAKFLLNLNDVDSGSGRFELVRVFDSANAAVLKLTAKRLSAKRFRLKLLGRNGPGRLSVLGKTTVGKGATKEIELRWLSDSGAGVPDGRAQLILNGKLRVDAGGLDTFGSDVDRVRIGLPKGSARTDGAGGSIHFDTFESNRMRLP